MTKKFMIILALVLALPLLPCQKVSAAQQGTIQVDLPENIAENFSSSLEIALVQVASGYETYCIDPFFSDLSIDLSPDLGNMTREEEAQSFYDYLLMKKDSTSWKDFLDESPLDYQLEASAEKRVRFYDLSQGAYLVFAAEDDEEPFAPMMAYIPEQNGSDENYFIFLNPKQSLPAITPRLAEDPGHEENRDDPVNPEQKEDQKSEPRISQNQTSQNERTSQSTGTKENETGVSSGNNSNDAALVTTEDHTLTDTQERQNPTQNASVNTAADARIQQYLLLGLGALVIAGGAAFILFRQKGKE